MTDNEFLAKVNMLTEQEKEILMMAITDIKAGKDPCTPAEYRAMIEKSKAG